MAARDILAQTHPTYDAELLRELRDLYVGGYEIQRRAEDYLPQLVGENATRWTERQSAAAFIGYLAHIVDHYASALFAQPIHARPAEGESAVDEDFYEAFANDADLASSSFQEILRATATWALVQKRALLAVDFPTSGGDAGSRAEEDALGLSRAYVCHVPTEQLIDWEYEEQTRRRVALGSDGVVEYDVGWFKWVVLYRQRMERASPAARRDTIIDQWKVWRRDESDHIVWELYEASSPSATGGQRTFTPSIERSSTSAQFAASTSLNAGGSATADVPLIASGVTSFQRIPLIELVVPDGLWIGNKIGPLNKEHWQRRSILNASENRALVAIPWVKLGPEAGGVAGPVVAHAQRDPERGTTLADQMAARGYVTLGQDDDIGYTSPDGGYATSAEERIAKLVDEIYRVSHLMAASVSSTANAVGRSGASKAEDRSATTVVLQALGAIVRDFAKRTMEVVSEARAEVVTWQVTGADRFDLFDRTELVTEATSMAEFPVPSKTLELEYLSQLAKKLVPNLAPGVLETVREEIEAELAKPPPEPPPLVAPLGQPTAPQTPQPPPARATNGANRRPAPPTQEARR